MFVFDRTAFAGVCTLHTEHLPAALSAVSTCKRPLSFKHWSCDNMRKRKVILPSGLFRAHYKAGQTYLKLGFPAVLDSAKPG